LMLRHGRHDFVSAYRNVQGLGKLDLQARLSPGLGLGLWGTGNGLRG